MRYFLVICLFFSTLSHAITLKPNCPKRYVVQHGDSLWSIANRYLEHPWKWKQLLHSNPNIKNPNRIYPGSVLVLGRYKNNPYIKVLPNGTIKLSPSPRVSPIEDPVPPIPLAVIKPFLNESLILDRNILPRAPYVIAVRGDRMLGSQGDEVYVKGLHPRKEMPQGGTIAYSLFRSGLPYVHPVTKQVLGFKAKLVGYGELQAGGEPATVLLTNITEGIEKKDTVLINNAPGFVLDFEPQAPSTQINGFIIDMPLGMPSGNTQGAVGEIVVISVGETSGVKAGDVLAVYSKPRVVADPKNSYIPIKLPAERVGEAMVFRAFTKTSFALILRSTSAVYLSDTVTNP